MKRKDSTGRNEKERGKEGGKEAGREGRRKGRRNEGKEGKTQKSQENKLKNPKLKILWQNNCLGVAYFISYTKLLYMV